MVMPASDSLCSLYVGSGRSPCYWSSRRMLALVSLFGTLASTPQTDTISCLSSHRRTRSRIPHSMSPARLLPSWKTNSNMVSGVLFLVRCRYVVLLLCYCYYCCCYYYYCFILFVYYYVSAYQTTDLIFSGSATWDKLFEPSKFFIKYRFVCQSCLCVRDMIWRDACLDVSTQYVWKDYSDLMIAIS